MARLLVLRGDSLEREIQLTGDTVRIGRGQHNELVLEDPGKSVSREHAEIRYEGGRYVIVDLGSQNGVWVSGSRVPYLVLEPNVVASIGPFKLTIDPTAGEYPPAQGDQTGASDYAADSGRLSADPVESAPQKVAAPANWFARQSKWLIGGVAVVAIGAMGFGVSRLVGRSDRSGEADLATRLEGIVALVTAGDCVKAVEDLEPILKAHPDDAAVLDAKAQADGCTPAAAQPSTPSPVSMTASEAATHLTAAAELIRQKSCSAALIEHINPVLAADASNEAALALASKANACISGDSAVRTPPAPPASGCDGQVARRTPPEQGGLELSGRCESERDYDTRVRAMRKRYDDALAALTTGAYPQAIALLEGIISEAGARYLDAASRLADARARRKDAAQKSYAGAQDFEKRSDWDRALAEYRRAHDLDPAINIQTDVARLTELRTNAGKKACEDADVHFAFGRNAEALRLYQDVVKFLPQDDPCSVLGRERFPQLKR